MPLIQALNNQKPIIAFPVIIIRRSWSFDSFYHFLYREVVLVNSIYFKLTGEQPLYKNLGIKWSEFIEY